MIYKLSVVIFLWCSVCFADVTSVRKLLESIIDDPAAVLPKQGAVMGFGHLENLSPDEADSLVPLAKQCLSSRDQRVRLAGLEFIMGLVVSRLDRQERVEPYIDDLAKMASDFGSPTRNLALQTLTLSVIKPSPKLAGIFAGLLDDKRSRPGDIEAIADGLLTATANDTKVIQEIIGVAESRGETAVKSVIHVFGLSRLDEPHVNEFYSRALANSSPSVRHSAIEAVDRLDSSGRLRFAKDLERIAGNPAETQENRTSALEALTK